MKRIFAYQQDPQGLTPLEEHIASADHLLVVLDYQEGQEVGGTVTFEGPWNSQLLHQQLASVHATCDPITSHWRRIGSLHEMLMRLAQGWPIYSSHSLRVLGTVIPIAGTSYEIIDLQEKSSCCAFLICGEELVSMYPYSPKEEVVGYLDNFPDQISSITLGYGSRREDGRLYRTTTS